MKNLGQITGYMLEKNEKNKQVLETMKGDKENYRAIKILISWFIFVLVGMSLQVLFMTNVQTGIFMIIASLISWYLSNAFINYFYEQKFKSRYEDIKIVNESLKVRMDIESGITYIRDKNNIIFKNALYLANAGTYQNQTKKVIIEREV